MSIPFSNNEGHVDTIKIIIILICVIGGLIIFIGAFFTYFWYKKKYGIGVK